MSLKVKSSPSGWPGSATWYAVGAHADETALAVLADGEKLKRSSFHQEGLRSGSTVFPFGRVSLPGHCAGFGLAFSQSVQLIPDKTPFALSRPLSMLTVQPRSS